MFSAQEEIHEIHVFRSFSLKHARIFYELRSIFPKPAETTERNQHPRLWRSFFYGDSNDSAWQALHTSHERHCAERTSA